MNSTKLGKDIFDNRKIICKKKELHGCGGKFCFLKILSYWFWRLDVQRNYRIIWNGLQSDAIFFVAVGSFTFKNVSYMSKFCNRSISDDFLYWRFIS